jgi:hypothetical protein
MLKPNPCSATNHPVFPYLFINLKLLKMAYLFTSESVSEGHPDKVADQISDALLDEFSGMTPNRRLHVKPW